MAALQPALENTPRPTTFKLRDSCHACASSKVKCHKEKPTCSRCAKRGITCEYFVTKRVGRKHENRSTDKSYTTAKTPQSNIPIPIEPASQSTSSEMNYFLSPGLLQPSPGQTTTSNSSDNFSTLFSPVDSFLSSVLTSLSTGFDDFSNTSVFPESSDFDMLNQSNFYLGDGNNSSKSGTDSVGFLNAQVNYSIFDEPVSELSNLSQPQSPPSSHGSSTSDLQGNHTVHTSADSPCFCLIRGLGLMKQLSPIAPAAQTISTGEGNQTTTSQTPTVQTVIAENEQIVEAVGNMLQCQCAQDGYLLTIMALIVFKVLGWYAAAARGTSASEDDNRSPTKPPHSRKPSCHAEQVLQDPTVVGDYCLDGEDLGRMAAQLVLNELHRVQRVVNQLSDKLKAYGGEVRGMDTVKSGTEGRQNFLSDSETNSPFSVLMLDQLETDIRKRLTALSLNIIDMLRRE
ncbi:uncharacterized protein LY89DRAFT_754499 [Mollisia scopiformis]|uniref:Zn(2)-C6 fungal-type domain-containing protein n=1 Tax=Mollisia scopiformis TaxID=149040 RepID=A0A194X089_MOLSC|nr:uncharacterized protein LY89DRAFT_754499 [Mollisia scopiformis]KUJ13610.1 hypothetical protein LY89DRAFT_754499 [Mollisia scopiformis]